MQRKGFRIWAISLVAVGFGLLTIKEGGAILFGGEAAQASAGNYVPFVLWFNFLAGFAYVIAGAGLWLRHRWAVWPGLVLPSLWVTALGWVGVRAGGMLQGLANGTRDAGQAGGKGSNLLISAAKK